MYKIEYKNINDIDRHILLDFYHDIHEIKKNKIDKLIKEEDKLMSILGEYLLAELLKRYHNIDYKNTIINYNENGKPYIFNYDIYYNISHSHNYVACIISNNECGIDIEVVRKVKLNNINIFTNKNEKDYILSDNEKKYYRLFEIFTLKEAYLKMIGSKIIRINDLPLTIKSNKITCSNNNTLLLSRKYKNTIISIAIKKSSN